ncbi:MAG: hypothetical protein VB119_06940 [Candidatus Metalachnospira sp.]|nr:hypothetical protein [Candidatus Metalachnospira sp.]
MKNAIVKLMKVKTLVTLTLTAVFAIMSCTGKIEPREFITVFTVIISFYFGTQHEKDSSGDESSK